MIESYNPIVFTKEDVKIEELYVYKNQEHELTKVYNRYLDFIRANVDNISNKKIGDILCDEAFLYKMFYRIINKNNSNFKHLVAYIIDDLLYSAEYSRDLSKMSLYDRIVLNQTSNFIYMMYKNDLIDFNDLIDQIKGFNGSFFYDKGHCRMLSERENFSVMIERFPDIDLYKKIQFKFEMEFL